METERSLSWTLLLATLLLGGCEQGLRVEVKRTGGVVSFAAARVASAGPVCLRDVEVMAVGSGEPRMMWHITAPDGAACIDQVTYTKPPPGFTEVGSGAPLAKGQIYSVAVKADSDLSGAQIFVLGDHDGALGADSG